ncbi:hypothetical protein [Pseudomonas chlororaphis]|uniref:hypothetical protein n=1 Tax=Pseudomonas chlororaphis TaxID=587753 RepID=UPI00118639C2|nr:hypothetical protein [Pseudomonas chlororaphis]
MISASTKNLGIAAITVVLIGAATALELNNKPSAGLWFLVVLLAVFTDWEKQAAPTPVQQVSAAPSPALTKEERPHD